MIHTYLQLAGLFASLSLLSIGGGNAVLPEMHLQAVRGHHLEALVTFPWVNLRAPALVSRACA